MKRFSVQTRDKTDEPRARSIQNDLALSAKIDRDAGARRAEPAITMRDRRFRFRDMVYQSGGEQRIQLHSVRLRLEAAAAIARAAFPRFFEGGIVNERGASGAHALGAAFLVPNEN